MIKICENPHCGKEFETSNGRTKYCSQKCAKYMHEHSHDIERYKDKPCENCGKDHDHTYGSGRFCSKECKVEYIASKNKGANNPKVKAHLDKLRVAGKVPNQAPYGRWKCKICGFIARTRSELKEHNKDVHQLYINTRPDDENGLYKCQFCGKEYDNVNSLIGHSANCPNHPNKEMHDEAHKRSGRTLSQRYKNGEIDKSVFSHKHTLETKEKLSRIRAEQVRNEYLTNFHAKVKWYKVKNINGEEFSVRGHWEENVALQLNRLGILWVKAKPIRYFKEYWHNYTADLYVPSMDVYVEVKGRYPDTDREKMRLVVEQNKDKKIYFIHDKYDDFISGKIPFDDELIITDIDL